MSSIEISKAAGRQAGLQRSVLVGWQHNKPRHAMPNSSVHLLPFSLSTDDPPLPFKEQHFLMYQRVNISNCIFCPLKRFCAVRTVQVISVFQKGTLPWVRRFSRRPFELGFNPGPVRAIFVLYSWY